MLPAKKKNTFKFLIINVSGDVYLELTRVKGILKNPEISNSW